VGLQPADHHKRAGIFRKVTNACTYSHKDVAGLLAWILSIAAVTSLIFGNLILSGVLAAALLYWRVSKPIRVLYAASVCFTAFVRTPEFLPLQTYFPGHTAFTSAAIRDEVRAYTATFALPATKHTFKGENEYIGSGGTANFLWRLQTVKVLDTYSNNAAKHLPSLYAALRACPQVISCAISLLEPGG